MGLFAALDNAGNIRFVGDVPRGTACGCFCPTCKSPLVSKKGDILVWHFAHEAGQERPECQAGSANLFRRLVLEWLREQTQLNLPDCVVRVHASNQGQGPYEDVRWKNTPATGVIWTDHDVGSGLAAQFVHEGQILNLYVGVGRSIAPGDVGGADGALELLVPLPDEGEVSSLAGARQFVAMNSTMVWRKVPDLYGAVQEARQGLVEKARAAALELQRRIQERTRQIVTLQANEHGRPEQPLPPQSLKVGRSQEPLLPPDAPAWAHWKKINTSIFAFQDRDGNWWIVMQSTMHDGCLVLPSEQFEGWDESLPPRIGTPDVERGAYVSDNIPIADIVDWFYQSGVKASRIDGDPMNIAKIVGHAR